MENNMLSFFGTLWSTLKELVMIGNDVATMARAELNILKKDQQLRLTLADNKVTEAAKEAGVTL